MGSSDNSVRVATCNFRQSKDPFVQKSDIEDKNYHGPFQNVDSLFEVLFTIDNAGGWINHLSFELNGSFLLVLPHSNHFQLYDVAEEGKAIRMKESVMKWNGLPFLSGYISDKGVLYAGGFDKKIAVFNRSAGNQSSYAGGFTFSQFLGQN